jgi:(p)ppGpp synthase/HD superfamily hydrolase
MDNLKKDMLVYEKAVRFAADAHQGSYRKGTTIPYLIHPLEVSVIVCRILRELKEEVSFAEYEIMAAAVLHDVVEDTDCSIQDIRENFGERIEQIVAHESEDKREHMDPAATWKVRKQEFLENLAGAPIEVKMIALADKLSNAHDLLHDKKKLGNKMWEKFNQKDKHEQEWSYRSVAACIPELKETSAYREYGNLLDVIFAEEKIEQ